MGSVKFSVFADIHFMNGFWCGDVDKRLDFILERAKKEHTGSLKRFVATATGLEFYQRTMLQRYWRSSIV